MRDGCPAAPPPQRLLEVLIAYRTKYGHCQRLGQRFEVKPSVRALAFGFFHQKPAQRFQLLIDRKESVPKIVRTRQAQADLMAMARKNAGALNWPPCHRPAPTRLAPEERREHQDMIAVNAMVAQTKLRNRHPRVPLFYPGAVPKGVRISLGEERQRRLGRKVVDRDGKRPGAGLDRSSEQSNHQHLGE